MHFKKLVGTQCYLSPCSMEEAEKWTRWDNDLEVAIRIINNLFKNIPSNIFISQKEAYYHSVVFLAFYYLGLFIEAEVHTSDGRLDAVVETSTHIYIWEFKLDETAEIALQQIHSKAYAERYSESEKTVVAVGINFDSKTKSVNDWKFEAIS